MMRLSEKLIIIAFALALLTFDLPAVTLKEAPLQEQLASGISNDFSSVPLAMAHDFYQEVENSTRAGERNISLLKAGIYSALLPGMGEYYVGHRSKARIFFAVEAATWISFFTYHYYGNWKEDDLINFAATHASANLEGKSKEFQDWVGFYADIDQFNSLGRVQDPERPYLVDNVENHWRWQTSDEQAAYRDLKNRSRDAFRRRDFMIGLAIVNRVVSIIDAVRDAKRSRRVIKDSEFSLVQGLNYRVEIDPLDVERPLSMSLYKRF